MIFKDEIKKPYYAVIFSSVRTNGDNEYSNMSRIIGEKVSRLPGFLGVESMRNENGFGITISYWDNLDSIQTWKMDEEHRKAKFLGKKIWYKEYKIRICKVEEDNYFVNES